MSAIEVVAALGILSDGARTLLVANEREFFGKKHLCWDIPGGGVNPGESLTEACVREVKEETGLSVVVNDLALVVERFGFRTGSPLERARFHFFDVSLESRESDLKTLIRPLDPEILDWALLTIQEIEARSPHAYQQAFLNWQKAGRPCRYLRVVGPSCAMTPPTPTPDS